MNATSKITPKFSILLPTKDRLDLLVHAIETVRLQPFKDWEIIVSDNASTADIKGYIDGLNDTRIKYIRTDKPIDVTSNWNKAYEAASGEYITMLGDDDGLTPDYFTRIVSYMTQLDHPDFIYHSAYHFAFPKALAHANEGFLHDITPSQYVFNKKHQPFILPQKESRKLVEASLDMRLMYSFNMQYFVFRRDFLEGIKQDGVLFYGPYPDFYLANVAFARTLKAGIVPFPLTIIGISPKSYGFYHFSGDEESAVSFLQNDGYADDISDTLKEKLLPGSEMNTQWLISVMRAKHYLNDDTLKLGIRRYRILQTMNTAIKPFMTDAAFKENAQTIWNKTSVTERIVFVLTTIFATPLKILPKRSKGHLVKLILSTTGQYIGFFAFIGQIFTRMVMRIFGLKYDSPWFSKMLTTGLQTPADAHKFLANMHGLKIKETK